ncbi:matrixin family metalloprotease [Hymenobacter puniceus]|uniref:matrixin family metalloprotease n=1 Tax=Hymenobacter sp. BT190 TaxID=2763505 RepID=UPI001650FF18|nr:matrixin family metalloprotease [Hymenobacter sp. BT190]MBC6698534.1 IPT/TIG domain-containing protein [Hymenobacter sp. BT190]
MMRSYLIAIGISWVAPMLGAQAQQQTCMLVPVPLSQRAASAALVVEAEVREQQTVAGAGGNLSTVSSLSIYKVLGGAVPTGVVAVAEPGGTLGNRREEVTGTAGLQVGQQGIFFLEPDPTGPRGAYRLVAGPQGLLRYNLPDHTATDPYTRYSSIERELYPALAQLRGTRWQQVQANDALQAEPVAGRAAAAVISSFAPASLAAGTGALLTITGTGFGTRGAGSRVEFPNADAGGNSYVAANATDYVSWTDTQIELRVPSSAGSGGAGSGIFRVTPDGGTAVSSATPLAVLYAYSNIGTPATRARLINDNGLGGYTLQYDADLNGNAAASAAFSRALNSWQLATGLVRGIGAVAGTSTIAADNVNIVRFDVGAELPAGVLGRATSRYSGCIINGVTYWKLTETDYAFDDGAAWNFGPGAPAFSQFDFESVALHELGHGHQLGHIIRPGAVMHYAIANSQQSRTLSPESDVAGGRAVTDFSLNSPNPCGEALIQLQSVAPLPVELITFGARYNATLPGTQLEWATASEQNSAYFVVQATDEPAADNWREVARISAAGQSISRRTYTATDQRPLPVKRLRYYRLRQVDQDGQTSFSPVVTVENSGTDAAEVEAYPNPVADVLHIWVPATEKGGQLLLLDATGRPVRELRVLAATGTVALSVADLRNGVYVLRWVPASGAPRTHRIVVQH